MTQPTLQDFGINHVNALLDKLHREHAKVAWSSPDISRLFFVDSDVLSQYVNGHCTDHVSAWPSLFALVPPGDQASPESSASPSAEAKALNDGTARAVTQFLLGQFRNSRDIQGKQLWLLPEQEREFDSVAQAVLGKSRKGVIGWQEALYTFYVSLYQQQAGDDPEAQQARTKSILTSALDLMVDNSAPGLLARTLKVQRGLTRAPTKTPIFPNAGPGSAFMLDATTRDFSSRTEELAQTLLQCWKLYLTKTFPDRDWEDAFLIKDEVLAFHRADRRLSAYVERVVSNQTLQSRFLRPRSPMWLKSQAVVAAHEVADIYTVARLSVLSQQLRESAHTQRHKLQWEVCFISGSKRVDNLLSLAEQGDLSSGVKLIHPLAVMRFDQFLYPAVGEVDSEDFVASGKNFALDVIKSGQRIEHEADKKRFLEHLRDLMVTCGAAFSPQQDRSLLEIKRRLDQNETANLNSYVRLIRETMAKDFVKAYQLLNPIAANMGERLSMISLPWLSLPFEPDKASHADTLVAFLHGDKRTNIESEAKLRRLVNEDDPTGYTDMLCAALGHLAGGRDWIRAAETLANSAAVLALNTPNVNEPGYRGETYRAEGNEALYLCAFISRMVVKPGSNLSVATTEWASKHRQTMALARERVDLWCNQHPDVTRHIEEGLPGIDRRQMVLLRYDVEDAARDVFRWLFDLLLGSTEIDRHLNDAERLRLVSALTKQLNRLRDVFGGLQQGAKSPALSFIAGQLFVASMQAWLCLQCGGSKGQADVPQGIELGQAIADFRKLLPDEAMQSDLIRALNCLFARFGPAGEAPCANEEPTRWQFVQFSELDFFRVPFLQRLLKAESLGPDCIPPFPAAQQ